MEHSSVTTGRRSGTGVFNKSRTFSPAHESVHEDEVQKMHICVHFFKNTHFWAKNTILPILIREASFPAPLDHRNVIRTQFNFRKILDFLKIFDFSWKNHENHEKSWKNHDFHDFPWFSWFFHDFSWFSWFVHEKSKISKKSKIFRNLFGKFQKCSAT